MRILKTVSIIFVFISFLLLPTQAFAQSEFLIDSNTEYRIEDSGKTIVTHNITLENAFSTLYATTYTLRLENIDVQNVSANGLQTEVKKDGTKTDIMITFDKPVAGKGKTRNFSIIYENSIFATHTGEVWELSIPKLEDDKSFRNYSLTLKVPNSFGSEAYISPKPYESGTEENYRVYKFNKDEVSQTGITAGFGAFQSFNFNLYYHLENPLSRSAEVEVAIPPDTAFQKIFYQKIEPKPSNIKVDSDGNWLAVYKLSPRERKDINVAGSVQIFAGFRNFPKPTNETLQDNLKATEVWQVNDPKIVSLAKELKTPKAIYDYVSTNLKYDYNRVRPNVDRLGAVGALDSPNSAICMEFTDLFIAIARAAGIPAREVNGFAYTENPEIQPLSLVADVLHAWPEYYDEKQGVWIPIDPTWGSTTGGVDFFSKLDLRHFTFVNHGISFDKPYPPGSYKLGTNPQKDIFVSFGKLPEKRTSNVEITGNVVRQIAFLNSKVNIKIYNPGPAALYNLYPSILFDGKQYQRDYISVLPPYSYSSLNLDIPFSILGTKTPDIIKVTVDDSTLEVKTNKSRVVVESLVILLTFLFIVLIGLLIRLKRIKFNWITIKISLIKSKIASYGNKFNKTDQNQPNQR